MSKKLLTLLLCASLLLNAAVVGGVLYVRYVAAPRVNLEAVSTRLDLDAAGRDHLLQMRRDLWSALLESRKDSQSAIMDVNDALATKSAGDPAFAASLDRLSGLRRERQERLLGVILAFRDTLSPESRERFTLMSKDPQFVMELIGLRMDADAR
ncbi:MAG TPA: periplasmic heavy metal sensor [Gammaproteobacteria bacterium]|jgi:uncharacterized membrane protein